MFYALCCVCMYLRSGNALYKSTAPSRVHHEDMSRHSLTRKYCACFSYVCLLDPFHLPKRKKENTNKVSFFADKFYNIHKTFSILWVCYIMLYSLFNVFLLFKHSLNFHSLEQATHTHTLK